MNYLDPFKEQSIESQLTSARVVHLNRDTLFMSKVKKEIKEDARTRILKTALKEFAIKGFNGVSTTEIAKVAGVTQPLIHYHFKTKEALWKAAVEQAFSWLQQDLEKLDSHLAQKELLIAFVRTLIAFAAKHPEVGQFLLREGMQESVRLTWMTEQLLQPAFDLLFVYHQQGVAEGWLQPIPFAQLSIIMTAISTHFFALAPMISQVYAVNSCDADQIELLTEFAVQLVEKMLIKPVS